MKIDDANSKPGMTALPPVKSAVLRGADKPAAAAPSADKVSISTTMRALAITDTSAAGAPFDAAQVEAIRTAITAGQFKVNPDKIADGLIDSVRSLLGRTHGGQ